MSRPGRREPHVCAPSNSATRDPAALSSIPSPGEHYVRCVPSGDQDLSYCGEHVTLVFGTRRTVPVVWGWGWTRKPCPFEILPRGTRSIEPICHYQVLSCIRMLLRAQCCRWGVGRISNKLPEHWTSGCMNMQGTRSCRQFASPAATWPLSCMLTMPSHSTENIVLTWSDCIDASSAILEGTIAAFKLARLRTFLYARSHT